MHNIYSARVCSRGVGVVMMGAALVCPFIPTTVAVAADESVSARSAPAWSRDARWFALDGIPRDLHEATVLLKNAGFSAVILPDPFTADGRHVGEGFPLPATDQPGDGTVAREQALIEWITQLHEAGLRVVVALDELRAEAIGPLAGHWLDPNGDGEFTDGLDGFLIKEANPPGSGVEKLARLMRARNRDAILVASTVGKEENRGTNSSVFDVAQDVSIHKILSAFLGDDSDSRSLAALADAVRGACPATGAARMGRLTGADGFRPLGRRGLSSRPESGTDGNESSKERKSQALDEYRLALMLLHFLPLAPVTSPADVVWGGGADESASDHDSLAGVWSAAGVHGLLELIRIQHILRARFSPIREGALRGVAARGAALLVLERKTDTSRIILVMNWSGARVRAEVAIGRPRHVVGVLTPQMRPGSRRAPFRISSTRQLTDDDGLARLPVGPHSARYIVVDEDRIRR